jgi:hypothetical protein
MRTTLDENKNFAHFITNNYPKKERDRIKKKEKRKKEKKEDL